MSAIYSPSTALLVVDVQNDFCQGGRLAVPNGDEVVPIINGLMPLFPTIVLTQDWHPGNHLSFASNHPGRSPFDMIKADYGDQVLWPDHCIQGSNGADFHSDLNTTSAQLVIRKGMNPAIDSYSAFTEADGETTTGLAGWLRAKNITDVVCAGLATDFCVAWTALDAVKSGFATTINLAASRAIDLDGSLENMLEQCRSAGVVIA